MAGRKGCLVGIAIVVVLVAIGAVTAYVQYHDPWRVVVRASRNGDTEALFDHILDRNLRRKIRSLAMRELARNVEAEPSRKREFEARFAGVRDESGDETTVELARAALVQLNEDLINEELEGIAEQVDPFVEPLSADTRKGDQARSTLPPLQPATNVDLVVILFRSARNGSLSAQQVGPRYGRPYTIGRLSGLTAAEIEASMTGVRRVGVLVRSSRVVGEYGLGFDKRQGDARRQIVDACLVDLETGRAVAVTRLFGDRPPDRIVVDYSSKQKWQATGGEPPLAFFFVEERG